MQSSKEQRGEISKTTSVIPGGSDGKASAYNAEDPGSIPGLGRSPGEGNGNPLQYSCLENPMGGGTWQAIVHGVAESQTRLSDFTSSLHLSDQCKEIEESNRMGKTRDLFKKIRDTKGTFHALNGHIKGRNGMDLIEAENVKKRW